MKQPVVMSIGQNHYTAVCGAERLELFDRPDGRFYVEIADDATGVVRWWDVCETREEALKRGLNAL